MLRHAPTPSETTDASSGPRLVSGDFGRFLRAHVSSQAADAITTLTLAQVVVFDIGRGATPGTIARMLVITLLPLALAGPLAGRIADRWSRQRVLAVTFFAGTFALAAVALGLLGSASSLFVLFFVYWLFTAPCIGLSNTLAFRHLSRPGTEFAGVRLWGTVGWMAIGWGAFKDTGSQGGGGGRDQAYPDALLQGTVTLAPDTTCDALDGEPFTASTMLCATTTGTPGQNVCNGDSGGPLLVSDGAGGWLQAGIVSWGPRCAHPTIPAVFTRVAAMRSWIDSAPPALPIQTYGSLNGLPNVGETLSCDTTWKGTGFTLSYRWTRTPSDYSKPEATIPGATAYRGYFNFDTVDLITGTDYAAFVRRYRFMLNLDGTTTGIVP